SAEDSGRYSIRGNGEYIHLCARAHVGKSNAPPWSRHVCFLPRERCYRLSLGKHEKILPLLRGAVAKGSLTCGRKIYRKNETQTSSNQFKTNRARDFSALPPSS